MEELRHMQEDVRRGLLKAKLIDLPEKYIGVQLKKIGGLSNTNYIGIVKNMSNNERILQVIYRSFGALSESVNHVLESNIIDYLAKNGIGPALYYEDPNQKFRITEYLEGCANIERSEGLDPTLMKEICPILNSYNLYSYSYKYVVEGDKISITKIDDGIKDKRTEISKNQFENCTVDWIKQGKEVYAKFSAQFLQKYSKEKNPKEFQDFEFVTHYVDNFNKYFTESFPTKGIFVLNHNDIHRLNFLLRKRDQKLFLLDHEYAFLNNPGSDMANYLNETFFNYEPTYYCTLDQIDFDKLYPFYKEYIEQFIASHLFIEKEEGGEELIKNMKTKKYLIMLMNIINLYWFIWSICYVDFPTWDKDHYGEYYFVHGVDRLKVYLAGMKALEECKE